MSPTADLVICGAGITGVAAAHFLNKAGIKDILLVDERPPLSLTSDRSTEGYRNWWPDAEMLALVNHSIFGFCLTAAINPRLMAAPVPSPTCRIRRRECAASCPHSN